MYERIDIGLTSPNDPDATCGLTQSDLARHVFVLGSAEERLPLLANVAAQLIAAGEGVMVLDFDGATASSLLPVVPPWRVNDTLYWNVGYRKAHVGFNPLQMVSKDDRPFIAEHLVDIFKAIWGGDAIRARSEYTLTNCLLTLLDTPGATLLDLSRLLTNEKYRTWALRSARRATLDFWAEFEALDNRLQQEAIAPLLNKAGVFRSNPFLRNVVGQPRSTADIDFFMAHQRVMLVDLGSLGEGKAGLLGSLLLGEVYRVLRHRQQEGAGNDFYVIVNHADRLPVEVLYPLLQETQSGVNLILGSPHVNAEGNNLRKALSLCGTTLAFRCQIDDARTLLNLYASLKVKERDLLDLAFNNFYLNRRHYDPFEAHAMAPTTYDYGRADTVVRHSIERYYVGRGRVERRLARMSRKWAQTAPEKQGNRRRYV